MTKGLCHSIDEHHLIGSIKFIIWSTWMPVAWTVELSKFELPSLAIQIMLTRRRSWRTCYAPYPSATRGVRHTFAMVFARNPTRIFKFPFCQKPISHELERIRPCAPSQTKEKRKRRKGKRKKEKKEEDYETLTLIFKVTYQELLNGLNFHFSSKRFDFDISSY